jgi:valyl-tRNA synthetase
MSLFDTESIMIAAYPEADKKIIDSGAESQIETVIEIIRSIRNVRAQYKVESNRWIEAHIHADSSLHNNLSAYADAVKALARANPVTFIKGMPADQTGENTLVLTLAQATVVIPMASMFDLEAERKRIQKELDQSQAEAARLEARLKDQAFLTKAPAAVIEKERQKLYTLNDKLEKLKQQSARL